MPFDKLPNFYFAYKISWIDYGKLAYACYASTHDPPEKLQDPVEGNGEKKERESSKNF